MNDETFVADMSDQLNQLSELGVIQYYLPSIPEGEEYVIGVQGEIIKLNSETVLIFLAGVTATSHWTAQHRLPSFSDAFRR